MSSSEVDIADVVRTILDEARSAVGSGTSLAERLEDLGVGPETGRYSSSAVSNWIKGRTMPPADVLMAAAQVAGISLDDRLGQGWDQDATSGGWEAAVADLKDQVDALRAELLELYDRTGNSRPTIDSPVADQRRAV